MRRTRRPAKERSSPSKHKRLPSFFLLRLLQHLQETLRRDPSVNFSIHHHGRRQRTVAQTINRLERECHVPCGLVKSDAEMLLRAGCKDHTAHRLAGFRLADSHHVAARCLGAEIVVETDDSMNLSSG